MHTVRVESLVAFVPTSRRWDGLRGQCRNATFQIRAKCLRHFHPMTSMSPVVVAISMVFLGLWPKSYLAAVHTLDSRGW